MSNGAKKHIKKLTLKEFSPLLKEMRAGGDASDIHENTKQGTIHHDLVLRDPIHKSCAISVTLPQLMSPHITRLIDDRSGKISHYIYLEIYGKWPLGRNRGEDPVGDQLMDMFNAFYDNYVQDLDSEAFSTLKRKICLLRNLSTSTPAKDLLNHPVRWEKYPASHEKAGDVDPDKSPNARLTMWSTELKPEDKEKVKPNDFIFNNETQKMLAELIDKRVNFWNETPIKKEDLFDEFTYTAGDYTNGKYPFRMRSIIQTITPKMYFSKKGPGDLQLKISKLEVIRKYESEGQRGRTEEENARLMQETLEADEYFNHKRLASTEVDEEREAKKAKIESSDEHAT